MVAQSHRRRGIGTALLEAAVDWGKHAGVRKLELHVFPWNTAAIALYERFGSCRRAIARSTTAATTTSSTRCSWRTGSRQLLLAQALPALRQHLLLLAEPPVAVVERGDAQR